MIHLCQTRRDRYRAYAQENGIEGPDFLGAVTTDHPAEQVADQMRELLDVQHTRRSVLHGGDDACRRLIDRIGGLGVLVMIDGLVGAHTHRRLNPEELRGFAVADPRAPLIFVDGADTEAAQIFPLIHEPVHIWPGSSAVSDAAMTAADGVAEELCCTRAAAEVEVPLLALRADCDHRRTAVAHERPQPLARARVPIADAFSDGRLNG